MDFTRNLDLLSVGIAVAATGILGFIVFFNNRKSVTSRTFLYFSLVTIFWGVINYLQYKISPVDLSFWAIKLTIFLGVWHSFLLFRLMYVFPEEKVSFPNWYRAGALPVVILTSVLTLTPLVFSKVAEVDPDGRIIKIENGPGIALFGIVVLVSVISGIIILLRKTIKAEGILRRQFRWVFVGVLSTFILLMMFNFILPAFFDSPQFIPLGAVFLFPFIVFTAYAILRYHLLNVKVIATEILTFVLAVVTLFEIILADSVSVIVFRSFVFILVLIFGILLIRGVRIEVQQREELQVLNDRLAKANTQLEDLSHFKTQLLSLASHQIKSPLAAIKGFVSILSDGLYGPVDVKIKEVLGKIKNSADGLIDLINNLLDLRKVEEGKMDYSFAKTDICALVKEVVSTIQPLADEKKLSLTYSGPDNEVFLNADGQKLKQVIQNLVDNAIKYTPSGFVKVELSQQKKTINFSVSDSGLGVSKELLPLIFEEFVRDERVKTKILGTGLGLYIARKIVEAHGGKIWAESEGERKGSKFLVTLPAE
ncbi:MAG: ATP-binding protein [Patescibacteria group bacterium]